MSANASPFSIRIFILDVFRSSLIIIAGFAIAPTHLLYSFYEANALFRGIAIFAGILTAIWGLCHMVYFSLKVVQGRIHPRQ